MKAMLKSRHFWGGLIAGIVLLAFVPQLNPRQLMAKKAA